MAFEVTLLHPSVSLQCTLCWVAGEEGCREAAAVRLQSHARRLAAGRLAALLAEGGEISFMGMEEEKWSSDEEQLVFIDPIGNREAYEEEGGNSVAMDSGGCSWVEGSWLHGGW